jgi:hypothetical protein
MGLNKPPAVELHDVHGPQDLNLLDKVGQLQRWYLSPPASLSSIPHILVRNQVQVIVRLVNDN